MESAQLIVVCAIVFALVFAVLTVLATAIALVTRLFPERAVADDGPVIAAITTAVGSAIPGARVTRIEEES